MANCAYNLDTLYPRMYNIQPLQYKTFYPHRNHQKEDDSIQKCPPNFLEIKRKGIKTWLNKVSKNLFYHKIICTMIGPDLSNPFAILFLSPLNSFRISIHIFNYNNSVYFVLFWACKAN